jgi:hypothetical protein
MVTIPVSMYQTVVTNIQNLTEAGLPLTMSAITGSAQLTEVTDEELNDASTTTVNMVEDVKTVLNGTQTSVGVTDEES